MMSVTCGFVCRLIPRFVGAILVIVVGFALDFRSTADRLDPICIADFDTFAYDLPGPNRADANQVIDPNLILSSNSWKEVGRLESLKSETGALRQFALVSTQLDQTELWILVRTVRTTDVEVRVRVLSSNTWQWRDISTEIHGADAAADLMAIAADEMGNVWGLASISPSEHNESEATPSQVQPILAKFEPERQQFSVSTLQWPEVSQLVWDAETQASIGLWATTEHEVVISTGSGVYFFVNSTSGVIEAFSALVDTSQPGTGSMSRALYLWSDTRDYSSEDWLNASSGRLIKYEHATGNQTDIVIPDDWPRFSGLGLDSSGRLWLGSVGYLDQDMQWQTLHPDIDGHFERLARDWHRLSRPASLKFIDSTNTLWYVRALDGVESYDGTAWFDPSQGRGCVISRQYTEYISEDSTGRLWMVLDDKIYVREVT